MARYLRLLIPLALVAAARAQEVGINPPDPSFELICAAMSCSAEPSEATLVCGTDGRTYRDACEAVCVGEVQPAYAGACVEEEEEECNLICPAVIDYVCGSDGITYQNQCALEVNACVSKTEIVVAYSGMCVVDPDEPVVDPIDEEEEECNLICPAVIDYVCGSDGVTYQNQCALEVNACVSKTEIAVAYSGMCVVDPDEPVVDPIDEEEEGCNLICPAVIDYVCGTDGVTYQNQCALEVNACVSKTKIAVAYSGMCLPVEEPIFCGTRANLLCPEGMQCTRAPPEICDSEVVADCPGICVSANLINCEVVRCNTADYAPVCDVDGVTHTNACVARCIDGVEIASFGECATVDGLDVDEPTTKPPSHICPLRCGPSQICTINPECDVTSSLPCPQYECIDAECMQSCPAIALPVCGTDGRTYGSPCALDNAKCLNPDLEVLYDGPCQYCGGLLGLQCPKELVCGENPQCRDLTVDCTGLCLPPTTKPPSPICPYRCGPNQICTINPECDVTSSLPCPQYECKDIQCTLPIDQGVCNETRTIRPEPSRRWAFDLRRYDCVEFTWYGCSANKNNFASEKACDAVCDIEQPVETKAAAASAAAAVIEREDPPCLQPPFFQGGTGHVCTAVIPAWSYDDAVGECVAWNYGGCGGNDNLFFAEKVCKDVCAEYIAE